MKHRTDSTRQRTLRERLRDRLRGLLRGWLLPHRNDAPPWLSAALLDALYTAGLRAIPSRDVPAAAAIIHRDTIVLGWNDVAASNNAAGHAEINAITNAMLHFGGAQAFKDLPHDEVYMVCTYEPCPMCAWALCEYGFRPENVVVLMRKERSERLRERRLFWRMRRGWWIVPRPDVQQRLFCRHPGYREAFPDRCP